MSEASLFQCCFFVFAVWSSGSRACSDRFPFHCREIRPQVEKRELLFQIIFDLLRARKWIDGNLNRTEGMPAPMVNQPFTRQKNRSQKSSSAWNLPMLGPVREREHFVDKLAIAEYKPSDMGDKSITKVSAATAWQER